MFESFIAGIATKVAEKVVEDQLDKRFGSQPVVGAKDTAPLQDPTVVAGKGVVLGYANNLLDQIEAAAKVSPDKVVELCEKARAGLKAILG